MLIKSTLIAAAAVAAISFTSPAFAQAFSKGWGSGNSVATYYDHDGGLHLGAAPQGSNTQIAIRRSGVNALAQVRRPSAQQMSEFRHGDYYAPREALAKRSSPQEQSAFRQGDFYAPTVD
ncbi:MAG: hypothetical protein WBB34_16465 [Xanthobacteraceae bacterium]